MSEEIKELFSSISPTYDRLNHLLSFNADKRWRKETINRIGRDRTESIKALDLCAGTMDLSLGFLNEFPNGQVYALDFSHPMLEHGLAKANNLRERIHPICADGLKLPLPSNCVDVVFCGFGFRNLDNKEKGLKEIHRVLKPKGRVLLLEFFRPTKLSTKIFHTTYGNVVLPTVGRLISKNTGAYRYLHNSISEFYSVDECKDLMKESGFIPKFSKDFLFGISSLLIGEKTQ